MQEDARRDEFHEWLSGRLSYVSSQPAMIPSSRSMLSRNKRLPLDTWNTSGLQENVIGNPFSTFDSPQDHPQGIHSCATQRERGSVPQAAGRARDDKQVNEVSARWVWSVVCISCAMVLAILVKPCSAVLKSNRFFFFSDMFAGLRWASENRGSHTFEGSPEDHRCRWTAWLWAVHFGLHEGLLERNVGTKCLGDLQFLAHRWQCTAWLREVHFDVGHLTVSTCFLFCAKM